MKKMIIVILAFWISACSLSGGVKASGGSNGVGVGLGVGTGFRF